MKLLLPLICIFIAISSFKSTAQAPLDTFACDNKGYISNNDYLYSYNASGTATNLFFVGGINALAMTKGGVLWAYKNTTTTASSTRVDSVLQIYEDGTIIRLRIDGLPITSNGYNVGAIDSNGYYYICYGNDPDSFYVIDTDPTRAVTYGQIVSPSATLPYLLAGVKKGTRFEDPGFDFADLAFNPVDGFLYGLSSKSSELGKRYRLIAIDRLTGNIEKNVGPITGTENQFSGSTGSDPRAYGAIFIDGDSKFYVFSNDNGHLYTIDTTSKTASKISTTAFPSNNIDGANCPKASFILSTRLISFQLNKNNEAVDLKWVTANEKNIQEYIIEKSYDGKNWFYLGTTQTKNAAYNEYVYTDYNLDYDRNYYRLKFNTDNEQKQYSNVLSINLSTTQKITTYPIPCSDILNLEGINPTDEVYLLDLTGKTIIYQTNLSSKSSLYTGGLQNGYYTLKIIPQNGTAYYKKIIKN